MIKKEIFRANRGEGKTKWLINKVLELKDTACDIYYLGDYSNFKKFSNTWIAETSTVCPVKSVAEMYNEPSIYRCYFITDELMDNIKTISLYWHDIKEADATWLITMSKEDFIN